MSKSFSFRLPYLLAGILLILLIFALLDNPNRREAQQDTYKDQPLIQTFDVTKVNKIELKKKEQVVTLQNSDTGWVVASSNNYRANKTNVEELLQKVKDMKIDSLASKNKEKQDQLEVTEDKGLHVLAYDKENKSLVDFFIGKTGPIWSSQYVRKSASDNVYVVKENLDVTFDRQANDWKDKTIVSFDQTQISQLVINYQDSANPRELTKIAFKKDNNQWLIVDSLDKAPNLPADQEKIQLLLSKLANLTTLDFIDNPTLQNYGLVPDKEAIRLFLVKQDAAPLIVTFGQKETEADYYYVRVEGNTTIFKVTKSQVEEFKIKAEDYKKVMSQQTTGDNALTREWSAKLK